MGSILALLRLVLALPVLATVSLLAVALGCFDGLLARRIFQAGQRLACKLLGLSVALVDHRASKSAGAAVFVQLNHTSLIDTLIIPAFLPGSITVVCNVEFALIPLYGWAHFFSGYTIIVRQRAEQAKAALQKLGAGLRSGNSFGVTIEGRRSVDGTLHPFKKGPVVIALEAGVPIVPVFVHGARECLPYGAWLPRPGRIEIVLLEEIHTTGLGYADRDRLLAQLWDLVEHEKTAG